METPKQKAIREAYGSNFQKYKNDIDENGWFYCGYCKNGIEDVEDVITEQLNTHIEKGEYYSTGNMEPGFMYWRPKNLSGLEDNNGWISILPDGSNLPKEEGTYFVHSTYNNNPYYSFRIDVFTGRLTNATHHETGKQLFTHYQPIIKPNPPIY